MRTLGAPPIAVRIAIRNVENLFTRQSLYVFDARQSSANPLRPVALTEPGVSISREMDTVMIAPSTLNYSRQGVSLILAERERRVAFFRSNVGLCMSQVAVAGVTFNVERRVCMREYLIEIQRVTPQRAVDSTGTL
jgi:hypothetical protein